jgi:hypothetical protein
VTRAGRETDGHFLTAGAHERLEARKRLLRTDGVSVTIA